MQTAADTGRSVGASLSRALDMFIVAIPRVVAFLVILVIGWILASLIAKAVGALLRTIRFNEVAERAGVTEFVRNMGVSTDASGVLGMLAKWFVRLIALVVAFDALGLPAVSLVLQQLLLWLPNLVVALVILVLAGLAGGAVSRVVRGATAQAGFTNPGLLEAIAKYAVISFGVVVAVNQLGIATTLINTLLIGVVSAVALATGLAFGLGGREKAAQWIDGASHATAAAAPKMKEAARAARAQSRDPLDRHMPLPVPMRADQLDRAE